MKSKFKLKLRLLLLCTILVSAATTSVVTNSLASDTISSDPKSSAPLPSDSEALKSEAVPTITVTDDTGVVIELAAPARRILSIAPHVTELLFEAGAGNAIIAVVDYSDFPPAAKELPRIGDSQRLDFEKILLLKPDLVVAWASGNRAPDLQRLEEFGLPIFRSEPQTLEHIATSIERFGTLTGNESIATKAAKKFRSRTERFRQTRHGLTPLRTFFQIWDSPLMTLNGNHLISEIITLCGGVNVFAELDALVPLIETEAVIQRDPEVILATGNLQSLQSRWSKFSNLSAVRRANLYTLPSDLISRQAPRVLDGADALCAAIDNARSH